MLFDPVIHVNLRKSKGTYHIEIAQKRHYPIFQTKAS